MTVFIKSDVAIDPAAVIANYARMADAVIDLNYETGRFWYADRFYASVEAIIAAGHGSATGGVQRLTLPSLPTAFTVFTDGVSGEPGNRYMMSLDDGSDGEVSDNLFAVTQDPSAYAQLLCIRNSVNQVLETNYLRQPGLGANGISFATATRLAANDMAVSYNGGTVKTDTSVALPLGLSHLVIGNRDDGLRTWTGTIKRIAIIAASRGNDELQALTAA